MTISSTKAEIKGYLEELEDKLYAASLAAGREALVEHLQALDDALAAQRDRGVYRDKGKRRSVLKTRLGEVEYARGVYETVDADGVKRYVYLLDEVLGQGGVGYVSASLSRLVTVAACETSYRDAARQVWELTGMRLSHTGAWNIVQQTGEQARAAVSAQAERAKAEAGRGSYESPILYEEMDGVWLKLQGKDRLEYGPSREMKVSIAYAGVRLEGPKRRVLENKVACAGFEPAAEFLARKEGVIAETYHVDEVRLRVLNSDGANWTHSGLVDTVFQLDPFHRSKAIREYVNDPALQETMRTLLAEERVDDLLSCVEASIESTLDPAEQENRQKLYSYFNTDRHALLPYDRRGIDIPPVNPGLLPARGGSMESNVFTLVGNRMKGRRACWSVSGANRLAALLCLRHTKGLAGLSLSDDCTVEPCHVPDDRPPCSAAKTPSRVGKGYNGFTRARIPDFLPWLKDMLRYKPLSSLTLT